MASAALLKFVFGDPQHHFIITSGIKYPVRVVSRGYGIWFTRPSCTP